MVIQKKVFLFALPIFISFLLHFHVFKLELIGYHVWRQTQTQTVIYNFDSNDNSIFHPQKFDITNGTTKLLYEFPLYQWLIAQYNKIFDYSVSHSRYITFIIFCFFLVGFFKLLKLHVNDEVALATNFCLCFSPLLYYYCVNPLPDIFALTLSTWSLFYFIKFLKADSFKYVLLSAILLSLATLIKLPYILFGASVLVYLFQKIKTKEISFSIKVSLIYLITFIAPIIWYAHAIPTWKGNGITEGIINNHKTFSVIFDFVQFHFISSLPELLTNYASTLFLLIGTIYCFKNFKSLFQNTKHYLFILIAFLAYFLFEVNMIEKTHDYYLMPFIPLIFLIVAKGIQILYSGKYKMMVFVCLFIVPITAWLRIDQRWNIIDPGFNSDYLNYTYFLQKNIPKNELCIIDSDESKFIILYYLKRNGFCLNKGELNESTLDVLYNKGAKYLVTENLSFNLKDYPTFNFKRIFKNKICVYLITEK